MRLVLGRDTDKGHVEGDSVTLLSRRRALGGFGLLDGFKCVQF